MDMDPQELYTRMRALTGRYAEPLRKYFPIVLGCMLYIAYLVMALIFFRPSFFACIGKGGGAATFGISIANAAFFLCLMLFLCRGVLPAEMQASLGGYIVPSLYVATVFLIMSYGLLFYVCKDPIACEDCDLEQETAFNDLVLEQVNGGAHLKQLRLYYKEQMKDRKSIALCSNYLDASYRDQAQASTCAARDPNADLTCNVCPDPRQGAPVLAEFFVMTSARTCVVRHQADDYVTDKMVDVVLDAGARCLDFDVYPLRLSRSPTPIVTVARDRDNHNIQRSYVPLELCFRRISTGYFSHRIGTLRDPLFVHLKLHRGCNRGCMDNIAVLLKRYFFEREGDFLLPAQYNHRVRNMGEVPICLLYNKLVVMVHTCDTALLERSALDGMVNVLTVPSKGSANAKECEWMDINTSNTRTHDFLEYNRRRLTFVRPSYHPYSPISNEIACGTVTRDATGRFSNGNKSDAMMDLIAQKQTINNDPTLALQYGCQFVAMNFQNLDTDMNKYIAYFKRASFVIKPEHQRRKLLPLTKPIKQRFEPGDLCRHGFRTTGGVKRCYQACVRTERMRSSITRIDETRPGSDDGIPGEKSIVMQDGKCHTKGYTVADFPSQVPRKTNGNVILLKAFVKPS